MKRKNKTVSFDLTDQYEMKLLKYAEKSENGKYSRYIKRLIAKDMQSSTTVKNHTTIFKEEKKDANAMSSFL